MGAVVEGVTFRLAGPEGTRFSANNVNIAFLLVGNSVGKTLGPPTSRAILATAYGQTGYAWVQLLTSLAVLAMVEWKMVGQLRKIDVEYTTDAAQARRKSSIYQVDILLKTNYEVDKGGDQSEADSQADSKVS